MRTSPAPARAVIVLMLLAAVAALEAQRGGRGGLGGPGGPGGLPGLGARLPPDEPQPPSQDDTPTFRSGVTLVQIDAFVTDRDGRPVTDLTADDFEILESGEPREITAFAAANVPAPVPVDLPGGIESDVRSNSTPPGRTYLMALDEMAPENAVRSRHILRQFFDANFGPGDVAAVTLTGRGLASSGQDFTNSTRLLLSAIDRFTGGFPSFDANATHPVTSDGRQLASSLRSLTEFLATLPGRKVLLLVAEGLGGLDAFAAVDYQGTSLSPAELDLHEAVAAATRGNVAIYPIDPRGATTDTTAAESFDVTNLSARVDLAAIADITGGFSLTGSNNFAGAFERIVRENSHYYTIGFASEYRRRDGRFVPVDVRVKRPGLRVASRDGFLAPLTRERRAPAVAGDARMPAVAEALASPLAVPDVPMRVGAAAYRTRGRNASVALVVEFDLSKLGLVEKDGTLSGEFEITYLATDASGKVRPGRRHTATLSLKQSAAGLAFRAGARVLSEFELPAGRYQLRVAAGGEVRAGSIVYDLDVPDFGRRPLAVSGLSLTVLSAPAATTLRVRDPLGRVLPTPPVASRDFASADTMTFHAEVYEERGERKPALVTADLRREDGTVVKTAAALKGLPLLSGAASGRGVSGVFPLADLQPGVYLLHVDARSADGRVAAREVPIRVW